VQVWCLPAATDSPVAICLGSRTFVVVPSPIRPALLLPQHQIELSAFRTHEWLLPRLSDTAPVIGGPPTASSTGAARAREVVLPSPSWPEPPAPQHHTPPLPSRPHRNPEPASRSMTPASGVPSVLRIWTAEVPKPLPQHHTVPPVRSAQACSVPAAIAVASAIAALVESRAWVHVGTGGPAIPNPSSPEAFSPAHHTVPSYLTRQPR
jgi:hypothetical protein